MTLARRVSWPAPPFTDRLAHPSRRDFPALDGLRGLAAILVVIFHVRSRTLGYDHFPAGDGYLAVDLFFFLSGIVLSAAYLLRFQHGLTTLRFMTIRAVRLYPLYFVGLLLGLGSALYVGTSENLLAAALSTETFFLPSPSSSQLFLVNNPAWSLFYELSVNFVFVLMVRLSGTAAFLTVIILSWIALLAAAIHYHGISVGNVWETAIAGLPRTSFSFFFGCFVHELFVRGRLRAKLPALVLPAIFALLFACLVVPIPDNFRPYYDMGFVTVLVPAMVIAAVNVQVPAMWAKGFTFLGITSYAVYAIHYPLIELLFVPLQERLPARYNPHHILSVSTYLAIVLVLAYVLDGVFDKPARQFLGGLPRRIAL